MSRYQAVIGMTLSGLVPLLFTLIRQNTLHPAERAANYNRVSTGLNPPSRIWA